jgi:hypothetical protein
MSANDDFPRGWDINSVAGSNVLVLPGIPGISHVITSGNALLVNYTASAILNVLAFIDDDYASFWGQYNVLDGYVSPNAATLTFTFTGKIVLPTGTPARIFVNTIVPVISLELQGYDI